MGYEGIYRDLAFSPRMEKQLETKMDHELEAEVLGCFSLGGT